MPGIVWRAARDVTWRGTLFAMAVFRSIEAWRARKASFRHRKTGSFFPSSPGGLGATADGPQTPRTSNLGVPSRINSVKSTA